MKYLILSTLLLIACSNTTEPSICTEYESVYIVTIKAEGVLEYESYPTSEECIFVVESYKDEGYVVGCERIVDNTGCN